MTPTVKYRPADNAARHSSEKVLDSEEISPDVVFDYDRRIVGIELLNASAQMPTDVLTRAA